MLNELYPEEKIDGTGVEAGIHCCLFSQYLPVDGQKMNFDIDIKVIHLAL